MREEEVRRLQAALKSLQRRQRRESEPVGGLTRSALRVLGGISHAGGTCRPRQLGDELQMTSSNVAAALRQLDAAGFVVRQQDAMDSRRVNVSLTEAGAALIVSSRAARDAWLAEAIDAVLDLEEQQVLRDAARLIERLATFEGGAVPRPGRDTP